MTYIVWHTAIGTKVRIPAYWFDHANLKWHSEPSTGKVIRNVGPITVIETDKGEIYKTASVSVDTAE